tara:strand:- start:294 stop:845 length:552 start_codon:yes stop_codon:yes gene_type:complete
MNNALIAKTPTERQVEKIVEPVVLGMGFELVRIRFLISHSSTLQIMVDKLKGGIEIDDLTGITTAVSAVLDVEDPGFKSYTLEVSSPGVDRPLTRFKDFKVHEGYEAKIEVAEAIDGRRRFRGILAGVDKEEVLINISEGTIGLNFSLISEARLVLTNKIIKKAFSQKRDKLNKDELSKIVEV